MACRGTNAQVYLALRSFCGAGWSWQTGMVGHPAFGNSLKLGNLGLSLHEGLKSLVFPLSLPLWFPWLMLNLMFKGYRPCHRGRKSSRTKCASHREVPGSAPQTSWLTWKVISFLPTQPSCRCCLTTTRFLLFALFCSLFSNSILHNFRTLFLRSSGPWI